VLENIFKSIQAASRKLPLLKEEKINHVLMALAEKAEKHSDRIIQENRKDLDRMPETDPKYDRLKLTQQRIKDIANDLRNVSKLPSPLGISLESRSLNSGLALEKVTVPLGVVGIIYEARPNVTFDVFSLCIKSGNAVLLKGGSDAESSNRYIVTLIKEVLEAHQVRCRYDHSKG
jgi:glutamate-5-semialdehyde dehydrogenase